MQPVIGHLNELFCEAYSSELEQSIDEHMNKFKGLSSMKQYIKLKSIKLSLNWWF